MSLELVRVETDIGQLPSFISDVIGYQPVVGVFDAQHMDEIEGEIANRGFVNGDSYTFRVAPNAVREGTTHKDESYGITVGEVKLGCVWWRLAFSNPDFLEEIRASHPQHTDWSALGRSPVGLMKAATGQRPIWVSEGQTIVIPSDTWHRVSTFVAQRESKSTIYVQDD